MTTENSPRLGLDYVMAAQAQKHVTVNETFRRLDALVQASAISASTSIQPSEPAEGDVYILTEAPTGTAWGQMPENSLAAYRDGEWIEIHPSAGWRVWLQDAADLVLFDGGTWRTLPNLISELENLTRIGVGTQADASNPFAAKLNAALWTALSSGEGGTGDLRYTLNKEAEGNILSLLFQSAYSGRAEIGLIGDNDLTLKLSGDGTVWKEVLRASPDRIAVESGEGLWLRQVNGKALSARRNLILNGDFAIGQRGHEFHALSAGNYFLDRWKYVYDGGMICDFSRGDFEANQSDIPDQPQHFLEWKLSGIAAGNPWIEQRIEGCDRLPEGSATLSLFAKASRSVSMVVRIRRHFGSGGSATQILAQQTLSLATGWEARTVTASVPGFAGKTFGPGHCLSVEFYLLSGETSVDIMLADVQLEAGDLATRYERMPYWESLRLCQRYFAKTYPGETAPGSADQSSCLVTSTSGPAQTAIFGWRYPTEMRISPAITVYSPASGTAGNIDISGADVGVGTLTVSPTGVAVLSAPHGSLELACAHITADAEL